MDLALDNLQMMICHKYKQSIKSSLIKCIGWKIIGIQLFWNNYTKNINMTYNERDFQPQSIK